MTPEQRVQNIETCMDSANDYLDALEQILLAFDKKRQDFMTFRSYYGSQEWYADRELPLDHIKRGVLSEDLPYDVIVRYREVAFDMLEKATQMLKDY